MVLKNSSVGHKAYHSVAAWHMALRTPKTSKAIETGATSAACALRGQSVTRNIGERTKHVTSTSNALASLTQPSTPRLIAHWSSLNLVPGFSQRIPTTMSKFLFAFLLVGISQHARAEKASCVVSIEDVNARATYTVEYSFDFERSSSQGQFRHFALPGRKYACTLAFFTLESGTMLSCALDEVGHHFVQSDRSVIDEERSRNNLTFRYEGSFFSLESKCE